MGGTRVGVLVKVLHHRGGGGVNALHQGPNGGGGGYRERDAPRTNEWVSGVWVVGGGRVAVNALRQGPKGGRAGGQGGGHHERVAVWPARQGLSRANRTEQMLKRRPGTRGGRTSFTVRHTALRWGDGGGRGGSCGVGVVG
jgi:hypothetical protein